MMEELKIRKRIYIQVDTNDGDYISNLSTISDEDLKIIEPLLEKVKENRGNFPTGEQADDNNSAVKMYATTPEMEVAFEVLDGYLPYSEWGFHTIETVKIITTIYEEDLV